MRGLRGLIATAMVALVVSLATTVSVGALAQSDDGSVDPAAVADINAHRVDGKHAVGAGATRAQRAGKLVATNAQGYLPSNILDPRPVTHVTVSYPSLHFDVDPNATGQGSVGCPAGSRPVAGGYYQDAWDIRITDSRPFSNGWNVGWRNLVAADHDITIYAVCLATTPSGAITTATKAAKTSSKAD